MARTVECTSRKGTKEGTPVWANGFGLLRRFPPLSSGGVANPGSFIEPPGLRVTVDRVLYQPQVKAPADRPHCFVYFISIHNGTEHSVTIKARKWVVTNAEGKVSALEGDGVVGQYPIIAPGEKFSYNSFHLIDTKTAVAEGSYIGIDEKGRRVLTRIPRFEMTVPG